MRSYAAESAGLRELCRGLLERGEVGAVVAWVAGDPLRVRVALIEKGREELLDRIAWSPFCAPSTATFLKKNRKALEGKRIGIVVKDCDFAALNVMLQENLINKDAVVTIGVRCDGLASGDFFEPAGATGREITSDAEGVTVDGRRGLWPELAPATCATCHYDWMEPDHVVGEYERRKEKGEWRHITRLRALPSGERRERFRRMFEACIRCYACREVCPVCSCLECAIDPGERCITPRTTPGEKTAVPLWASREREPAENAVYLITRAMHMAGRCVRCGWCERACPVGIPLMEIIDLVNHAVSRIYLYEPGRDPALLPFLASFSESDPADSGGEPL
ncbi:MAG: 4Fe-4S binding protein [Thermoplasmata archaeon]